MIEKFKMKFTKYFLDNIDIHLFFKAFFDMFNSGLILLWQFLIPGKSILPDLSKKDIRYY